MWYFLRGYQSKYLLDFLFVYCFIKVKISFSLLNSQYEIVCKFFFNWIHTTLMDGHWAKYFTVARLLISDDFCWIDWRKKKERLMFLLGRKMAHWAQMQVIIGLFHGRVAIASARDQDRCKSWRDVSWKHCLVRVTTRIAWPNCYYNPLCFVG